MVKKFAFPLGVLLALLLWSPLRASDEINWEHNMVESLKKAEQEKKLAMVFFQSKLCGTCRQLKTITLSNKDIILFSEKHFVNIKVDIDAQSDLAKKWNATVPPVLVFMNSKETEFARIVGYQPPATLQYLIQEIARGYNLLTEGAEKIKKNPDDAEGNYGVGVGLRVQRKYWDAKNYLEKALRNTKDKDLLLKCNYELANTYFYIPRSHTHVIEHAKAVVEMDPQNSKGLTDEMLVTLSVGYFKAKEMEKAFEAAGKVITQFPKSKYVAQAYHFKGLYAVWMKKQEEALAIWKEGMKLFPDDPWSKRSEAFIARLEKKEE